jgi:amino acid transporter
MYVVGVLLLMVVLPIVSIGNEHYLQHSTVPLMLLAGKWFVFWSAGIRLCVAGMSQFFQPRFTAKAILGINSDTPLPFVRELGAANFATGTVGILSIVEHSFVLPVAIAAALFFGIVGIRHATDKHRNLKQNLALATGLFVSLVLAGYIAYAVAF